MSDLLAQIDALDVALASNPQLNTDRIRTRRSELARFRHNVANDLKAPATGMVEIVHGAKVTHRPDVAYTEAQRQAAGQGADGGYLPIQRTVLGTTGTIQEPAPERPAVLAKTGIAVR